MKQKSKSYTKVGPLPATLDNQRATRKKLRKWTDDNPNPIRFNRLKRWNVKDQEATNPT